MEVTLYRLPDGRKQTFTVNNINDEDAAFFENNNLSVSMEELRDGSFVLYSTTNISVEDEDDLEIMYLVPDGQSCNEAMNQLRANVEETWKVHYRC